MTEAEERVKTVRWFADIAVERCDLDQKIARMQRMVAGESLRAQLLEFKEDNGILKRQLSAMIEYRDCLDARIAALFS